MAEKINAVKFGLSFGILTGLCAALTTIFALIGIFPGYTNLAVPWLRAIYGYVGYTTSWLGVFLGGIYAGLDAFVFVWLAILIYNKLAE